MAERELKRSEQSAIRKLVTELCANYDSQDKICLPLDSPCYMLNKWWTGAYCRYFEKSGVAGGCSTGISHYRRGHLHETENMLCVWKIISSYNQPGILLRCLPGLCKTEIRAETQTPAAAKPTMICPQLSPKSP